MKKIIRIFSLFLIVTGITFFLGQIIFNRYISEDGFYLEENINKDKIVRGINYGILQTKSYFNCETVKEANEYIYLDGSYKILCSIGKNSKGLPIYSRNGMTIYFNDDVFVNQIIYDFDKIEISYYVLDKDYLIFYGTLYDFYNIEIGDKIHFESTLSFSTKVFKKEIQGSKSVFYSENGNFHLNNDRERISVSKFLSEKCFYIENIYLLEPVENDKFLIYLYNKYIKNLEEQYYDKIITVRRISDQYSVITSNNVSVDEYICVG